jgi:mannose-1-phosphate guanylyltransferase
MAGRNGAVTKAAVLCGGEGNRLKPLTNYFQKTMIPIGPRMRPALEYAVKQIVIGGIKDITLLTGYKADEVESYFEDGSKFGARITYSRDPTDRHGSAHALVNAIGLQIGPFDNLLVYYGDVLSTLDVGGLVQEHRKTKADATLVLSKNYVIPVGVATVKGGRVVEFREKPAFDHNVTMGTLVISGSCLPVLRRVTSTRESRDIMSHFVSALIAERMKVVPYYHVGVWFDIGTSEVLERRQPREIEEHLKFLDKQELVHSPARLIDK